MSPDYSSPFQHPLFVSPDVSQCLPSTPNDSNSQSLLPNQPPKGLEFDDVLLWDFFKDSPCKKGKDGSCAQEWRTLYDYWMDNGGGGILPN